MIKRELQITKLPRFPRMTVGVMGSAGGRIPEYAKQKVFQLGAEAARRGYVLVTGACPGLPHEAVRGASSQGGIVVGVSPALNLEEHIGKYHSPTQGYNAIIYTGSGLMGREIENIRSCDVVVFAGGRSGTLGEFAIAYDEGKVIGVILKTGGISRHIKSIVKMVKKKTDALIIVDADPVRLLDKLERVYKKRIYTHYLQVLEGHAGKGTGAG